MKLSTIIKELREIATTHQYFFVRKAKHGELWRDKNGNTINFGGTSTDPKFHRKVIRDMKRHGHNVEYVAK